MNKKYRYLMEYALLRAALGVFGVLPVHVASNLGGALMRGIGPHMGISRVARRQLGLCFPQWEAARIEQTITDMWDNLGRVIAEYPHLDTIAHKHVRFANPSRLQALKQDGGPIIFVSGHMANWEALPCAIYAQFGIAIHSVYRAPNNPHVDALLVRLRSFGGVLRGFGKNRKGLAETLRALNDGHNVGMLIDQKMNTGLETSFFGQPAMTSTAFVELARKLGCPVVSGRLVRMGRSCNFEAVLEEDNLDVGQRDTQEVVADMQGRLEAWISAQPAQWLWVHRRWKTH